MLRFYIGFQQRLDKSYRFDQRFPICDQSSFIDVLQPL